MLTLYDVANDEEKLRKWMTKYKIVAPVCESPRCGAAMKPSEHMGKPYYRCTGPLLFADSTKAYIAPAKEHGLLLSCVDHGKGEYTRKETIRCKMRTVSTQGIDGACGRLKVWLGPKGGVYADHVLGYVNEFQWRNNMGPADLFVKLGEHIRDG